MTFVVKSGERLSLKEFKLIPLQSLDQDQSYFREINVPMTLEQKGFKNLD